MTVVVSDTGPLNYLVLCGAIDILPRLFEAVVVPSAVLAELEHEDAPAAVRRWAEALPSWVEVRTPRCSRAGMKLGWGERETIFLALEVKADLVLIDDRAARRAASERGLNVAGTLGILERAAVTLGLELPGTLNTLMKTTFRIDAALIEALLERDARRRG